MLTGSAEVWWFLNKPEKEALECVGSSWTNVSATLLEGRSAYVSQISIMQSAGFEFLCVQDIFRDTFRSNLTSSGNKYIRLSRYAIVSRDIELLRFWLQCCQEAMQMKCRYRPTNFSYDCEDLTIALERGLVEELAELIRTAGAELPLDALIKKSGIEETAKPKYYQGLSIGGKKMSGWAREHGGRTAQSAMSESTPPVLQAAHAGGLAAVEWFMSDTPLRLYREYREKHRDDERLRKLAEAPGGFEQAVRSWLKQRSISLSLVIHSLLLIIDRQLGFAWRSPLWR